MYDVFWYSNDIETAKQAAVRDSKTEFAWILCEAVDYDMFDLRWLPNRFERTQCHVWGSHNNANSHTTWLLPVNHLRSNTATGHNYHADILPGKSISLLGWEWVTDARIDYADFNFDWLPDSWDADKIHCFTMHGCEHLHYTYLTNSQNKDSTFRKYHVAGLRFKPGAADDEWVWEKDPRIDYTNFDFNWLPDTWDINLEHCFAMKNTEQLSYTKLYNAKQAISSRKYHKTDLVFLEGAAKDEWVWETDSRIDYSLFDFNWLPDSWDMDKTHYFCMEEKEQLSYTRLRNMKVKPKGDVYHASDLNFKEEPRTIIWPDYITHEQQYEWLCSQYIEDEWVWVCDSRINYANLNKRWLPDAWDAGKIHCFAMRNQQQLSYTWLVNTKTLHLKDFKYLKTSLRFEKSIQDRLHWPDFIKTVLSGFDWQDSLANWVIEQESENEWIWVVDDRIDYGDFDFTWLPDAWDNQFIHCFAMKGKDKLSYTWLVNTKTVKQKNFKYHPSDLEFIDKNTSLMFLDMGFGDTSGHAADKKIRFTGNMVDVLRSAVRRATNEWVWVASSCCDYANFKFDWLPDLDKIEYTHCWPAPMQIKGETFLIHVPTFLRTDEFLWSFEHEPIPRYRWPTIYYTQDNLADAINQNVRPASIYTLYHKSNNTNAIPVPAPCLWEKRPVIGMSECNSVSLVPRDCIVKKEIYEYPYLDKDICTNPVPMEIVFLHNGEVDASKNFDKLNHFAYTKPMMLNGITPRLKAYQTAAEMVSTDWVLTVFAKCHMKNSFANFQWRPDYWQQAKHYIFYNENRDLDLTYGHMAPIAYSKRLMLENKGGLDMTLAQEHAVVPIVISETTLTDPWDIWRTAFRETAKLLYYRQDSNNLELEYRLDKWMSAEQLWYKRGAQDARDYFESTNGEYSWLMLTNEWDWLSKRFKSLYSADLTT